MNKKDLEIIEATLFEFIEEEKAGLQNIQFNWTPEGRQISREMIAAAESAINKSHYHANTISGEEAKVIQIALKYRLDDRTIQRRKSQGLPVVSDGDKIATEIILKKIIASSGVDLTVPKDADPDEFFTKES